MGKRVKLSMLKWGCIRAQFSVYYWVWSHGTSSIWDQRRGQQQMPAAPARYVQVSEHRNRTPAHALISRDAADPSIPFAVACCTSRLITDARHLRSTHLFATCGCLHELGRPSLVTRQDTRRSRLSRCSYAVLPFDQNNMTTPYCSS